MKKLLILGIFTAIISCGKKDEITVQNDVISNAAAPYDTLAIDSFSAGATSASVAAQIRRSSQLFQDSIKNAAEKVLLEKAKAEELKAEKDKKTIQTKTPEPKKKEKSPDVQTPISPKPETPVTP